MVEGNAAPSDVVDGAAQIELLIHGGRRIDATLEDVGVVAVLVEERVEERTEAFAVLGDVPALGRQRILHGHVLAPDLPDGAPGIADDLRVGFAPDGRFDAHVVVGGVDASLGRAVNLLILRAGEIQRLAAMACTSSSVWVR